MEPTEIREFRGRISRAIKRLREEEGISAQYLAKVLRVTQPTVSRIESGASSISAENLCFLSKTFNRPLAYFIGEQSPIVFDEEDVLRAGLVHYGAYDLKAKRTINVLESYKTYADFLNAALKAADEPRFAAALATSLYKQAAENKLEITRILTTVENEILVANLFTLLRFLLKSESNVQRPDLEKKKAFASLKLLYDNINKQYTNVSGRSLIAEISPDYIARFINASLNRE